MTAHRLMAQAIRTHQFHHPRFGEWYRSIYTFTDRTMKEFWEDERLPPPILSMARTDGVAHYDALDELLLEQRITLNPWRLRTGVEAAEAIAHELVHMIEHLEGYPTIDNLHRESFHETMFDKYGIKTRGESGRHHGNDGRWDEWLEECSDLRLNLFRFPGESQEAVAGESIDG